MWPKRTHGPSEATRARERAEEALERTKAETPMYRALGERLKELRERNHLAEAVAVTFRGEVP